MPTFTRTQFTDYVTIIIASWLNSIQNVVGPHACVPTYSASSVYVVGQYTAYNYKMYRCITQISTPESFNASHWEEVNVGTELQEIFEQIGDVETALAELIGG